MPEGTKKKLIICLKLPLANLLKVLFSFQISLDFYIDGSRRDSSVTTPRVPNLQTEVRAVEYVKRKVIEFSLRIFLLKNFKGKVTKEWNFKAKVTS